MEERAVAAPISRAQGVPGIMELGPVVAVWPASAEPREATRPAAALVRRSSAWAEQVGQGLVFAHSAAGQQQLCLCQPRADKHSEAVYCPDQPRGLDQPRADRGVVLISSGWPEEEDESRRPASRPAQNRQRLASAVFLRKRAPCQASL